MSAETTDGALEVISGVQGRPARLAVLISGGGTTLLNFLEQMKAGLLPVEIPLVIFYFLAIGVGRIAKK